ncbi:hypothetical protein JH06_4089 [Blastocystis sp. subtype 4]|uniref:hypothetical protein n=1 Tax=Blastocystis sp. subtype 4 TaxID=944170 RepID=UPI0007120718|nr:hypothetical protein JH06_4089 [Blastocystis sp. subtype 4]KNB42493.1 hypothetical protein JH06_4089 [Blastocystis sp. subtype 4]|eukprot:XP_014525936.1 hypothetical protein JH06_4089 [Blastocystis sp. subtype 4]
MQAKQPKMTNSQRASELSPPKLDNPYLPYSAIAVRQHNPLGSSQAGNIFYNQKLPYRGDMYSMYLTQETVAPNPTMPVPFKPMQPSPIVFYPSYGQQCYPPLPPNQQSTPILSPYFNQSQYSPYSIQNAANPVNSMVPSNSLPLSNSGISNSPHQSAQRVPTNTGTIDPSSQSRAPQEEYREMKFVPYVRLIRRLTRDRAAARLRRMRKKASIETTEMRIDILKSHTALLQNAPIPENRQGLFVPFQFGESMLFSHEERLSQYQFLLSVWQTLFKRQKKIHTILSLLMWTMIPESTSAPQEEQRRQLRDALQLSETQKRHVLSMIRSLQMLEQKLDVTSMCLLALGMHTNILLSPLIDKGNETFTNILTATQIQKLHSFFRINERTISKLPVSPPGCLPETDVPSGLDFKFVFCVCFKLIVM